MNVNFLPDDGLQLLPLTFVFEHPDGHEEVAGFFISKKKVEQINLQIKQAKQSLNNLSFLLKETK